MKVYEIGGAPDWVCANSEEEAISIFREYLIPCVGKEEAEEEIKEYPPSELSEEAMNSHQYIDNNSAFYGEDKQTRSFAKELKRRTKPEMFAFTDF